MKLDNILYNWEVCMDFDPSRARKSESQSPPASMLKFNVDGTAGDKLGPARYWCSCNDKGEALHSLWLQETGSNEGYFRDPEDLFTVFCRYVDNGK